MSDIKSLAMMKMEKNFKAYLEKEYPRQPYKAYTLFELLERAKQEMNELDQACHFKSTIDIKEEIADVSNILDYLYEVCMRIEKNEQ